MTENYAKRELLRAGLYFYGFVDKVNDEQLTRFEKFAYKHCVNNESLALEKLSFWVCCELAARSIDNKPGGLNA